MAKPKITMVDISSIKDRENSQRKDLKDVESLADSISRIGLLHPVIIDENSIIITGGRRLAAHKLLVEKGKTNFQKIPTILRNELSDSMRRVIELEENVKRADLDWQEQALAILELDAILVISEPNWLVDDRADYIGVGRTHYYRWIAIAKAVQSGHPLVCAAPGPSQAFNIIERERDRKQDNVMNALFTELQEQNKDTETEQLALDDTPLERPMPGKLTAPIKIAPVIQQGNFHEWAPSYTGPAFNLIHCDFPYGLDHGNSDQGGAKGRWESYDDKEDVYWQLIKTFLKHRDQFMLPSCHIIFWFSMKFYGETIRLFNELAPELDINYLPLIWHKTDNKGIIRDVKHTPRHVYETALFITRGDRQIIKAVGDAYGAPTRKAEAGHISEKPVPVLRHFMQLCVDGYSEVFDPTAGGGSAIRAAHSMGAKRVFGLELNKDYAESAQREYEQTIAIESLRKDTDHE